MAQAMGLRAKGKGMAPAPPPAAINLALQNAAKPKLNLGELKQGAVLAEIKCSPGISGLKKFKAAANVMKAVKRMSDWVKMTDPATGETFYENKKTGDLSWNDPEETPGAEVISGSATF